MQKSKSKQGGHCEKQVKASRFIHAFKHLTSHHPAVVMVFSPSWPNSHNSRIIFLQPVTNWLRCLVPTAAQDIRDQWFINPLMGRWLSDQCAADYTGCWRHICLYGGEKRALGCLDFPVCWLHCSQPFMRMAQSQSDEPSAKWGEQNSKA